jgi:CheY-like chemotaxis protein
MSTIRVVFVDDEAANCRLGLRMLLKLGVLRENITFLTNGAWLCAQPVSVLSLKVGQVG